MKTDVQFRVFMGEVIAVFPYEVESGSFVQSYQHVGQHSLCVWWINANSRPATEQQYKPLFDELTTLGYILNIIKRRSHNKFLAACEQKANNRYYKNQPL